MGRSFTYHVVGVPTGAAMNRVEMAQAINKASKGGQTILWWIAQTKVGERILGGYSSRKTADIPLPTLVRCPICQGDGSNGKYFCMVCSGSGICRKGNESRWQPWQLDQMRSERKGAI